MYEIIGNERIISNMRSSIINQKVTHAYIIDGLRGTGKKLLSGMFAKALQCMQQKNGIACENCQSCKTFDTGSNPDIIYVRPTKTKALSVDDIREQVIKNMETKPYSYRYKIFIIDNASDMTIAAQNALLKTLEEPADYGIFLLLSTNIRAFLPTILSRTVVFQLKPIDFDLVKRHLINKIGMDSDKAHFCAVYAQGNVGRALEIATSESFADMRQKIISIMYGIKKKDMVDIMLMVKQFDEFKDYIRDVFDIITMWFRDVLFYKETNETNILLQQDIKELIITEASESEISEILEQLSSVFLAERRISQNGNFSLTLEVMLLQIALLQTLE